MDGIGELTQLQRLEPIRARTSGRFDADTAGPASDVSFGDVLKGAIAHVDHVIDRADHVTEELVLGKDVDLHDVTIATEQAQLALQFTIAVRNKLVEAYQEIMRMQV